MPHLTLTLLGAFQAQLDNQPLTSFHSTKVQGLLAYLAVEAARPHARESLMALFWPDDAPQSAQQSLRQALYALRRTLGDTDNQTGEPFLLVTRQTVQFNPAAAYTLDMKTFLQQVQQGNLEQAAALYTAELLTGLTTDSAPFEEWLRSTRQYLHNLALNALHQLTQQQLDHGDYRQAALYARRQLALEPWREEAHRQVMTALAYNGDRSAALAQYESCRRVLAEELGVDPAEETITLYEQIRSGQLRGQLARPNPLPASPGVRAEPPAMRHNLAPQPTPFIGRKTDLEQITTRLDDPTCRLLTIVGPGGMGKTRLAIAAAQSILEREPPVDNRKSKIANPKVEDGIFFVALAGVASPDLLVSTIASVLDFTFYGSGDPKSQLLDYLKRRSLLLVLDNCEHLLAGIELVADLLAAAPKLKVLATSREPLNLREEWLHVLGGMSFPHTGENGAMLEQYTAVQLFIQCARRMKPAFDLAAEGNAVVQICQLVDGMPLGIELAATWLKFYGCTQIIQEMQRSLDFLATTLRNLPARHRSMRAVFEHSWHLLSPPEQAVFQRLAVFRGGFRLEAAEQVAAASFPLLVALAEKSLVQPTPSGRYQMHELLRQFAEEKLHALPHEWSAVQERHGHYYLLFLHQHQTGLEGRQSAETVASIEEEIENIRLAWQWALRYKDIDAIGLGLGGLHLFFWVKHWYQEGEALLAQTASMLTMEKLTGKQRVLLGRCLAIEAHLLSFVYVEMGRFAGRERVESLSQQSLAILREANANAETGLALICLANYYRDTGKLEAALTRLGQALDVLTAQGNSLWLRRTLHELDFTHFSLGDYDISLAYLERCIELCEACGDLKTLGDALNMVGYIYGIRGDYHAARQASQAALDAGMTAGDKRGAAWALQHLGEIAWHTGDYTIAQQRSRESLALFTAIGAMRQGNAALNTLGNIAASLGDYAEARRCFNAVLASWVKTGQLRLMWIEVVALTSLGAALWKESRSEQAVELLTHVLRQPAGWQATRERASALLAELEASLPAEQFTAARQQAETQDLFTFVAALL